MTKTVSHKESKSENICIHIFSASATLVGVCLTVIGIIHILIAGKGIDTYADDFLVLDAMVFLAACLLSYWGLRAQPAKRMYKIERIADILFISGLLLMVVVCAIITYALVD